jgi:hypothetical protein
MRTFAQKQKVTQQAKSADSMQPARALSGRSRDVHSSLHLQRTIDRNSHADNSEARPASNKSIRFGHDFSRIPVHAGAPVAIQPKLTISTPGDYFEQEADKIAEEIVHMSDRECGSSLEVIQRSGNKAVGKVAGEAEVVEGHKATGIQSLRGNGSSLPASQRGFYETRFGHNFSDVRIHTDSRAAELARSVNARAFTLGQDVVFGSGEYAPQTHKGKRILAHELTHVVQQGAAPQVPSNKLTERAIHGSPATSHIVLQRSPGPDSESFPATSSNIDTVDTAFFKKKYAAEWSKDNSVRKIDNDDLEKWGKQMTNAKDADTGSGTKILAMLGSMETEVATKLGS